MAAVAAPKICRETERKGREGRKEREKRGEKRKERERRAREKDVYTPIWVLKHPLRTVKRLLKTRKEGGWKKLKKQEERKKAGEKMVTSTEDRLRCENIGSVFYSSINGCRMGPLLVLISSCFRENVIVTCKIESFLCSLDSSLQKTVIVFLFCFVFFGNQISKWRSFEKRAIFDLLFTFFSHQRKVTKIPLAHNSLTYVHVSSCSSYWLLFLRYQFWKKDEFIMYGFSLVCFLVLILIRAILEQSINNKMVSKI